MGYFLNVKKLYIISFFNSLIPAYVIERLFWQARGMNVQMVVYCEIIYAATVILLELPSGVLADRLGRKPLLVLDGLLSAAELLVLLFARSFWMFGLAVLLAGVGKAFSSGSQNALLYDSLLAEGRQEEFEKLYGRLAAVDFAGSVLAALCGGLLAGFFPMELNYIISAGSMLVAFFTALTLREPPMHTRPEGELAGLRHYAGRALGFFSTRPRVLLVCCAGAMLGACLNYLDEFWQLLMEGVGVQVVWFGLVSALMLACRVPGNVLAYRLKERFGTRAVLAAVLAVNAAGYLAICLTRSLWCLVPVVMVCLTAGFAEPLVAGYLHHRVGSGIRATVESLSSLGLRLLTALVGLGFAAASASASIFAAFGLLAAVCGASALIYAVVSRIAGSR